MNDYKNSFFCCAAAMKKLRASNEVEEEMEEMRTEGKLEWHCAILPF